MTTWHFTQQQNTDMTTDQLIYSLEVWLLLEALAWGEPCVRFFKQILPVKTWGALPVHDVSPQHNFNDPGELLRFAQPRFWYSFHIHTQRVRVPKAKVIVLFSGKFTTTLCVVLVIVERRSTVFAPIRNRLQSVRAVFRFCAIRFGWTESALV